MFKDGKVNVGIIGAGGIAQSIHLPCLSEIIGINVAAVCDIEKYKAERLARDYGITGVYALYHDMIEHEQLDAVFILVQPDISFRIAMDCLDQGLDVFVEKPAGITSYQAEALLRKSIMLKKILQVGFNRRYIPLVTHVLNIMREVTQITQVEGCFFKNGDASFYGGCSSAFMCDTIHAIDLVRYASGSDSIPIKAATISNRVCSDVSNMWNSVFSFDNNVTGIIKANYLTGGRIHTFELHGPRASAFINLGFGGSECEARIMYFNGRSSYSAASAGIGTTEIEYLDGLKIANHDKYYGYYGYLTEDAAFIDSVLKRKPPIADIREAMLSMETVELLEQSIL